MSGKEYFYLFLTMIAAAMIGDFLMGILDWEMLKSKVKEIIITKKKS